MLENIRITLLNAMGNFMCQFGWATVLRYLVKEYSRIWSKNILEFFPLED